MEALLADPPLQIEACNRVKGVALEDDMSEERTGSRETMGPASALPFDLWAQWVRENMGAMTAAPGATVPWLASLGDSTGERTKDLPSGTTWKESLLERERVLLKLLVGSDDFWKDFSEPHSFSGTLGAGQPHLADEDLLLAEEQKIRAENRLELILAAARIRNECYGPAQVQEILGVSRERLRQLREKGRLVGITGGERKGTLYPYWQFDPEGDVFDGIYEIYSAAKEEGMTERQLHFFMTERNHRLDGRQPAEILLRASRQGKAGVREAAAKIAEVIRSSGPGEP